MKHLHLYLNLLAAAGLLTASCSVKDQPVAQLVPVTVQVNDIVLVKEPTRSAQNAKDYENIQAIDLAFFAGNTVVYQTTQLKSAAGNSFGTFSCSLPIGTYTMAVIARNAGEDDVFTLSSPTLAAYTTNPKETFCATQSVTVTQTASLSLNVTLNRIMAMFRLCSLDLSSPGVASVSVTYGAGAKSFNPSTGLASNDNGFVVSDTPYGQYGYVDMYFPLFLADDEESMDVTLEAFDADENSLFTTTIQNVPFQRNCTTKAMGNMFTASASSATFKVETEWLPGNTVSF